MRRLYNLRHGVAVSEHKCEQHSAYRLALSDRVLESTGVGYPTRVLATQGLLVKLLPKAATSLDIAQKSDNTLYPIKKPSGEYPKQFGRLVTLLGIAYYHFFVPCRASLLASNTILTLLRHEAKTLTLIE